MPCPSLENKPNDTNNLLNRQHGNKKEEIYFVKFAQIKNSNGPVAQ
jgi:hypothetical protein